MEEYTIYCSAEQTKMALTLGVPIDNARFIDTIGGKFIRIPEETGDFYSIPTTEQMIGWLEEQGIFINIDLTCDFKYQSYLKTLKNADHNIISKVLHHSSRQEATLAAIDAALNHLEKQNVKK